MSDEHLPSLDRDRVDSFLAKTIDSDTRKIIWASTDNILKEGPLQNADGAGKTGLALGYVQSGKTTVITTLIAAIMLFGLGSGPVKGFAVTLSIGILTSMFTAIMFTRILILIWLRKKSPERINL